MYQMHIWVTSSTEKNLSESEDKQEILNEFYEQNCKYRLGSAER